MSGLSVNKQPVPTRDRDESKFPRTPLVSRRSPPHTTTPPARSRLPAKPQVARTATSSPSKCRQLPSTPPTPNAPTKKIPSKQLVSKVHLTPPESPKLEVPTAKAHCPYNTPHTAEPCITHALVHKLECGHKVVTMNPEHCASNCHRSASEFANPWDLSQPFVCMNCTLEQFQKVHAERETTYRRELQIIAKTLGRGVAWQSERMDWMKKAWFDTGMMQMAEQLESGRFCHAIYATPEYDVLADMVSSALKQELRLSATGSSHLTLSMSKHDVKDSSARSGPPSLFCKSSMRS